MFLMENWLMKKWVRGACVLLLAQPGWAHAEEPAACSGALFETQADIAAAVVTAPGKTYFFEDALNCPDYAKACRMRHYMAKGNHILVAQQDGLRVCAWFSDHQYSRSGWIDAKRVEREPTVPVFPHDFVGHWRSGDNQIEINQLADGGLYVSGDAYWPGKHIFPEHEGHIGLEEGVGGVPATLHGNVLVWKDQDDEFECAGQMRLINGVLIVNDNGQCGGFNVSFTDIYHRTTHNHHQ